MKKVTLKIFLFLLPLVLILIGVEVFYRFVPNNYTLKKEAIQKRFDNTQVLVLGNSHTFYGVNPDFFDKPTYNLASISQTIYFDQLLLENYLDKFKKLNYVVLNVEFTSLSQPVDTDEDTWRKYFYESYMDLKVPIISRFDPRLYILSANRNFNSNFQLIKRYFTEGSIVDCDENGFGSNYKEELKETYIAERTPLTIEKHEDHLLDFSKNQSRIQSIISRCEKRGIKIILVTMPVSKFYAEGVNQTKLQKIFNTCMALEKSNSNVHYLNLFKDPRFNTDDFFDTDHLHSEGAKKCSQILNRFINSLRK